MENSIQEIELRPFPPFLPPRATVMMMGSFPPSAEKRAMAFHYPNFQNDMWRVYGLVFFGDVQHFQVPEAKAFDADRIKAFLMEEGIASCPTVKRAIRRHGNASEALSCSRIARRTVGQEAMPRSVRNALIFSASNAFSSPR